MALNLPPMTDAERAQILLNVQAVPPAPTLSGGTIGAGSPIVYVSYVSYVVASGAVVPGYYVEGAVSAGTTDSDNPTVQSPPPPSSPTGATADAYNVYSTFNTTGPQLQNNAPIPLGTDYTISSYQVLHATREKSAFGLFFATLFPHSTTFAGGPDGYSGGGGGGGGTITGLPVGQGIGPSVLTMGNFSALPSGVVALSAVVIYTGAFTAAQQRLCGPNGDPCTNAHFVGSDPEMQATAFSGSVFGAFNVGTNYGSVAAADIPTLIASFWIAQQHSFQPCFCFGDPDHVDIMFIAGFRVEVAYTDISVALDVFFPGPPPPPPPPQLLPYLFIPKGQGQSIDELEGHSDIAQINVETVDVRGELKKLAADPTVIGRIAKIKLGFPGMCLGDFVTLHTTKVTEVNWTETGRMEFIIQDIQRYMDDKYIFNNGGPDLFVTGQTTANDPPIGDAWNQNGIAVDDHNIRWLFGNPMDIYLAVLQNECGVGQADQGDPGSWQIYVPGNDSTIINPSPYIDVPRILALRDGEMSGIRFEFKFTRPVQAKNWLDDQILKPLGLYTVVRSNGLLYLKGMKSPESVTAAIPINDQNILGIPRITRLPIVNYVTFRLDVDDSVRETAARQYQQEFDFQEPTSIARYNQYFQQDIESTGMRVNYGGFNLAFLQAQRIFTRHAFATPKYTFSTWLKYVPVELGDFFLLTHPRLLDLVSGTLGVAGVLCEVVNRDPDYAQGKMTFDVLDTRFMSLSTPHYIAPGTGGIPTYPTATDQQKAHYFYISNSAGQYSTGDLGDEIF